MIMLFRNRNITMFSHTINQIFLIIAMTIFFLGGFISSSFTQVNKKNEAYNKQGNSSLLGKTWSFISRSQRERRTEQKVYSGAFFQGGIIGYHITDRISVNISYAPQNHFTKADGLEIGGISEGLGFTDGANDNTIFGITGVQDYDNLDKHLTMLDFRYFLIQSFFVSSGLGFANSSERTVFFTQESRTIGSTLYDDADLTVKVRLHDAFAFNLGAGVHHFFGPVGLGFTGVFGILPRRLKATEISSNQNIANSDIELLNSKIKNEVETEHFGFYEFVLTYSF